VKFDKANIWAISPRKILFSKYGDDLLVLYYDEYHENNNLYLIQNEKEPFIIGSMKKYIRGYFEIIYKMNCKLDDKKSTKLPQLRIECVGKVWLSSSMQNKNHWKWRD